MQSSAKTVREYIASISPERQADLKLIRKTILKHLPKGYKEVMQYGMIGYVVPLSLYPTGYLGKKDVPLPYIALASQKNYFALYMLHLYQDKKAVTWLKKEFKAADKKLDMGKSCVRFKTADDLPLNVVAKAVALLSVKEFIKEYEEIKKQ